MSTRTNKIPEKEEIVEVFTEVTNIPDFDQYINKALTQESYNVVKEAIFKTPDNLSKIMQYVNSSNVKQEQLEEIFSRSVY